MQNVKVHVLCVFLFAVWKRRGGDSDGRRPVSRVGHVLRRRRPRVAEGIVLVDGVEEGAVLVAAHHQEAVSELSDGGPSHSMGEGVA